MTLHEQRQFFLTKTPSEFMEFCLLQINNGQGPLSICRFVQIRCLEETGVELRQDELLFKEMHNEYFNDLDITGYLPPSHHNKLKIKSGRYLDGIISDLRTEMIKDNTKNGKNVLGIAEVLNALYENVGFTRNKPLKNGRTYDKEKLLELLDGVYSFSGKRYQIQGNITIKLSAKAFAHILVGHVSAYKIPRKGHQVLFTKINNWRGLLLLIEQVIKLIEGEIIEHFSKKVCEFNKTDICIDGVKYSIHINQQGSIKTFYENVLAK